MVSLSVCLLVWWSLMHDQFFDLFLLFSFLLLSVSSCPGCIGAVGVWGALRWTGGFRFGPPALFTTSHGPFGRGGYYTLTPQHTQRHNHIFNERLFKHEPNTHTRTKIYTYSPMPIQVGQPDLSYFSLDCVHLSEKTHSEMATALWNNMVSRQRQQNTHKPLYAHCVLWIDFNSYRWWVYKCVTAGTSWQEAFLHQLHIWPHKDSLSLRGKRDLVSTKGSHEGKNMWDKMILLDSVFQPLFKALL